MALILVPNSGQSLDETRDPIKDNFTFINSGFLVNHVELNTGPNSGKHKFLQMPSQLNVDPTTGGAELALYAKNGTVGTQMFIRQVSDATPTEFTYALKNNNGWTRLPSGILMVWGQVSIPISSRSTLTFPNTGPNAFTTLPYSVQVTGKRTTVNPADPRGTLESFSTTQIVLGNSSAVDVVTVYYLAIGV